MAVQISSSFPSGWILTLAHNMHGVKAKSVRYFSLFTLIIFGFGMPGITDYAIAQPSAFIVFSTNPSYQGEEIDPGDVRQEFTCNEQIYAISGFEGIEPGIYTFTTRWMAPDGQTVKEDKSQLEMLLKRQVAYLATSLQIQVENQTTDETSPFSGEWRVEVIYEEEVIGSGSFEFKC